MGPTGKGWGERHSAPRAGPRRPPSSGNGISYHGGPVMSAAPANVYFIWYGNWLSNSAQSILPDLINGMNATPYYNMNTTYYDGANAHIPNAVGMAGSTSDSYSQGAAIGDASVRSIVSSAISSGRLPNDGNGVYFVLTSSDVNETSGFCTQYCGWHSHASVLGKDIKYAFIGNPDRCPGACSAQTSSPNGNPGADAMASIISHELSETVTDPDLNAWYDSQGAEDGDKCAWTFGAVYPAGGGGYANVRLNSRDFLLQELWVNASGGYCGLSVR